MKDVKQDIARRVGVEVRNIKISPLFIKGKRYDMDTEKEDEKGLLSPEWTHCWLTWETAHSYEENGEDVLYWTKQAYSFSDIESAKEGAKYIESLVK